MLNLLTASQSSCESRSSWIQPELGWGTYSKRALKETRMKTASKMLSKGRSQVRIWASSRKEHLRGIQRKQSLWWLLSLSAKGRTLPSFRAGDGKTCSPLSEQTLKKSNPRQQKGDIRQPQKALKVRDLVLVVESIYHHAPLPDSLHTHSHLWLSSSLKRALSCSESLVAQLSSSDPVRMVLFCFLRKGLATPAVQPTLALNSFTVTQGGLKLTILLPLSPRSTPHSSLVP